MQSENDKALTKGEIKMFHHRMKLNAPSLPVPVIIKTVENISYQLSVTPKVPSEFELDLTYKRFIKAIQTNQWDIISLRCNGSRLKTVGLAFSAVLGSK
jgi:hypothetical protein